MMNRHRNTNLCLRPVQSTFFCFPSLSPLLWSFSTLVLTFPLGAPSFSRTSLVCAKPRLPLQLSPTIVSYYCLQILRSPSMLLCEILSLFLLCLNPNVPYIHLSLLHTAFIVILLPQYPFIVSQADPHSQAKEHNEVLFRVLRLLKRSSTMQTCGDKKSYPIARSNCLDTWKFYEPRNYTIC